MSNKEFAETRSKWESVILGAIAAWPGSGRALARAAQVDHVQLARFVRGEMGLGLRTAERLAGVLGLDLVKLADLGTNHAKPPVSCRKQRGATS